MTKSCSNPMYPSRSLLAVLSRGHAYRALSFASLAISALVGCAEAVPVEAQYPTPLAQASSPTPASIEQAAVAVDSEGFEGGQEIAIGVDNEEYADADPSALTEFKPALDPYGAWAEDPNYGTVWTPSSTVVGPDFAPYVTAGRWTHNGEYTWVSDYDWGWAPFHYGRWVFLAGRGWSWIPGRRYAGAWVVWRTGDSGYGFVGWAPAPPLWYWRGGYAYGVYAVPAAPYVFCPVARVFEPGFHRHIVTGPDVAVVGARTRPYVPARPTVNTVNADARILARPSVTASTPVRAPIARVANGPALRELGVADGVAPAPPADHRGLERARELAQPRVASFPTAVARPPIDPRFVGVESRPLPSTHLDVPTRLPSFGHVRPDPEIVQPMPRGPLPIHVQPAPVFRPLPQPVVIARPLPLPTIARPLPTPVPVVRPYVSASPAMRSLPQISAPMVRPMPQVHVSPSIRPSLPQIARPLVLAGPRINIRR
jgi:hypothetical protein